MAKNPAMLASMEEMYKDIKSGRRGDFDARDYAHNRAIDKIMQEARRMAWAKVSQQQEVQKLIQEQRARRVAKLQKRDTTANLLNIYK